MVVNMKSVQLTENEGDLVRSLDKKNWSHFCENHHGDCYWNKRTGAIMWMPNDGSKGNLSEPTATKT